MADFGTVITLTEPTCTICLVEYEHGDDIRRSFHCNHVFHSQCILDWLVEQQEQQPTTPPTGSSILLDDGSVIVLPPPVGMGPQCPCCRCEFITQQDLDRITDV